MSDQTTIEVVLSSESTVGTPIVETVTVIGTVPIGPRGQAAVNDGDKGDVVVSGSGTVWTIEAGAVTPAKLSFDPATQAELDAEAVLRSDGDDALGAALDAEIAARAAADTAEAALARNADNLTSGTVADARIASTIARDSEVSAAVAASEAGQVRDGDAAGGVLSGTYPNPGFAADMATQAELDAVSGTIPSTEAIQDVVGAMLTDSATVDFTYDDTAGTFTAVVQGLTSGSLSDFAEAVRDRLGSTLVAGTGITVTVDDPGDTVTIATTITQYTDEMARDAIGAALVAGTNITITPNDGANTITIDATGGSSYTDENAQDAVGTILADSATIDFTYTDATPEITAVVKDGSITAAKVAADVATQAELDAKVSDTAYDATSWNGVTDVAPSKNAVRDELEATATEIATAIADGDASTLTSAQTYADGKVSNTAYDATSWNGDTTHAPSKDAVRDKIESLGSASVDDTAYDATSWNGVTTTAPSKNAVRDKVEALDAAKAPLASPTFTGTVTLPSDQALPGNPTTTTQSAGNSSTRIATTAFVGAAVTAGPHVKDYARATRSSGNVTINGTSWANVDTGTDLVLTAATGDVIEVAPSGRLAAGVSGAHTFFDVATIVSGSAVNYFGTAGGASDEGVIGWRCHGDVDTAISGSVARTLVSGDISGGTVTLRLRCRQDSAGNRLFVAGTTNPFSWYAKNLGPAT